MHKDLSVSKVVGSSVSQFLTIQFGYTLSILMYGVKLTIGYRKFKLHLCGKG